jgi:hypothetical protein
MRPQKTGPGKSAEEDTQPTIQASVFDHGPCLSPSLKFPTPPLEAHIRQQTREPKAEGLA